MTVTPETLTRHELVGLDVEVVAASNPDVVGTAGTVVTETTRTLGVEAEDRVWHVPKEGATFAFDTASSALAGLDAGGAGAGGERTDDAGVDDGTTDVPDDASGRPASDGGTHVRVDGAELVARPARRTERTGDSRWR